MAFFKFSTSILSTPVLAGTLLLTGGYLSPIQANDLANSDAAKADNVLTIDHLMQMKSIRDVQISPDGQWVAYVVGRIDEEKDKNFSQIWMSAVNGDVMLPMTARYANASSPRWSPDGSKLAFLGIRGDRADDEAETQVWMLDRRGGEAQQHTQVEQGVNAFAFAPTGDQMVLVIKDKKAEPEEGADEKPEPYVIDRLQFKQDYVGYLDRRRTHLYLFDGTGDPVQITSGDYDDENPVWSPDGTMIAFVSKRDGDPDANSNSDIWTVMADPTADNHPLTQITTNKGPDHSPSWSPDGQSIAHITSREPEKIWYDVEELAIAPASGGGDATILTEDYDRFVYSPAYAPDGQSIFVSASDEGDVPLIEIDVQTKARMRHSPADSAITDFAIGPDGEIAYLKTSHDETPDLYIRKGGKDTRLTHLNSDVLDGVDLARVERLTVPGWNGTPVESFVYYPADYVEGTPHKVIFNLHGGPVSQHSSAFDYWGQLYAAHGYVAVLPNPHGSSGYGEAFSHALNAQWGVPDFADIEAIADYLVENDIADPQRMGVGGWSYGGILTNYVITQSTRFAAAVTGASEVNHRANYGHDIYQHEWEVELGLPWENIEAWESINPFNNVGNVTTPTLVTGGQHDWNVPIQNSEQLYQALKRRGIATQLVVYPDEHHGIRKPTFVRDRYHRFLDWYAKYMD
jgi:dipeptidyl aminopeptidase/acylaminoacyl peptidase